MNDVKKPVGDLAFLQICNYKLSVDLTLRKHDRVLRYNLASYDEDE